MLSRDPGRVLPAVHGYGRSNPVVTNPGAHIRRHGDQLEAIALNAGIGMGGDFATQTDLDQELKLVDLNVRSTVHLAKMHEKIAEPGSAEKE